MYSVFLEEEFGNPESLPTNNIRFSQLSLGLDGELEKVDCPSSYRKKGVTNLREAGPVPGKVIWCEFQARLASLPPTPYLDTDRWTCSSEIIVLSNFCSETC